MPVPGAASMSTSQDTPPGSYPGDPDSDTLLYNNILLYCNLLQLYKFNTSIHDGNIGQTFKVIKVILTHFPSAYSDFPLQWLCFYFFGTGSSNYGNELLHQACNFWWQRATLQYLSAIWSTHLGCLDLSMNTIFSRSTSISG